MKSLVILTGGKSSRMGRDKAMLPVQGETFVERIFANALTCFDHVIISVDTEVHARAIMALPRFVSEGAAFAGEDGANAAKAEFVLDNYDAAGPIGGILSVFEETQAERFSIISVDVPKADMHVLSALWDGCTGKASFLQMKEGRGPEPLIAAYDRSSYEDIERSYKAGVFKLRRALTDGITAIAEDEMRNICPETMTLDFGKAFKNYNTQEELDL